MQNGVQSLGEGYQSKILPFARLKQVYGTYRVS